MAAVKMSDIAREAGVSIATVGRVIHRNGYVSEEVRAKVEDAIRHLGYVPNTMARALKSQRSSIIGSLVLGNRNDLYRKINGYLTEAAERRGFQMITIQSRMEKRDEDQILKQFMSMRVDGLAIISDSFMTSAQFAALRNAGIPVVAIERTYDVPFLDNIVVRDLEGVYEVTTYFLKQGHRRVGLIAPTGNGSVERLRLEGFRRAMEDGGVPRERQLVRLVPSYSSVRGKLAMEELLALPAPPTGVFCTSDTLAAGAMQALQKAGKRVPEDMSIVGYDNVLSEQLAPPIDSVDLDLGSVGEMALSLLESRKKEPDIPSRTEYLGTIYVSRGTIQPPGAVL